MKQTGFIDIKQSLIKLTEIFADPNNLNEYQDRFIRKVHISGNKGKTGAVSKMYYKQGENEMELIETITKNDLPHAFEASYQHKHMDNTMKCRFTELSANETRYEYEYEYTRINWVVPRLIAILFPSMYKKPAEKWLRQFKTFSEKQ